MRKLETDKKYPRSNAEPVPDSHDTVHSTRQTTPAIPDIQKHF